ncbi:MAG: hypothetical protein RJB01_907 [Actinomycetota bacterium]|jgi:hypothetical protein
MTKSENHDIGGFHLNHKQLDVLEKVYAHPVAHNLTWHDLRTLLDAVGDVEEKHNGSWRITIGGVAVVFDPNHGKELSTQEVMDLRHMLTGAGLEPGA